MHGMHPFKAANSKMGLTGQSIPLIGRVPIEILRGKGHVM